MHLWPPGARTLPRSPPPAASAPVAVTPQPQSATKRRQGPAAADSEARQPERRRGSPPGASRRGRKLRTRLWRRPRRSQTCRRRRASSGPKLSKGSQGAAPHRAGARPPADRARTAFERDPAVGFLIVVGGPGLGSFRPIFEGNNTVGRSPENRIPLDFGDDAISNEAQAYLRYDSNDRSFLFVPNLAKTNVVSVNDKRPTGPVPLQPMDVITIGRTQVAFLPFCGADFDWSEISEA